MTMSIVLPPATILVTGANGFLASWICLTLLEKGYSVRGAVRTESKGAYLRQTFEKYGDKFQFVVVPDMSKSGAYDEAVRGVGGVIHVAAKVTFSVKHPDEIVLPAVNGVKFLLNSIQDFGVDVRRVVYTSSGAVISASPGDTVTEETAIPNDHAVEALKQEEGWTGPNLYTASKLLAETTAWDYVKETSGTRQWEFVSLLPPYIFGPYFTEVKIRSDIPGVPALMYSGIENEIPEERRYGHFGNWADVRDIALAHALALQKEEAGGERFIISAGPFTWQDIYNAVHSQSSPPPNVPKGNPDAPRGGKSVVLVGDKSKKVLGITYRSMRESVTDMIVCVRETLDRLPQETEALKDQLK